MFTENFLVKKIPQLQQFIEQKNREILFHYLNLMKNSQKFRIF